MENIPHSLAVEIVFLILIKFDETLRNSFVFIDVGALVISRDTSRESFRSSFLGRINRNLEKKLAVNTS